MRWNRIGETLIAIAHPILRTSCAPTHLIKVSLASVVSRRPCSTRRGRQLQRLVGRRLRGYPCDMAQATPAELLQHALRLPVDDRLALATELLESVEGPEDPEWAEAWAAELDRRVQELDEGRVQGVPWSEVKAKIEARLRAK